MFRFVHLTERLPKHSETNQGKKQTLCAVFKWFALKLRSDNICGCWDNDFWDHKPGSMRQKHSLLTKRWDETTLLWIISRRIYISSIIYLLAKKAVYIQGTICQVLFVCCVPTGKCKCSFELIIIRSRSLIWDTRSSFSLPSEL